ncbi:TetR/AcrR family transcriptional regulator [Umezawaea endophytica]|uniref:TetR/AcrR family transcriptional regulator n=1 Tax=Umezawaea endophytica TaxID=1654476 RepID=A0A9X2VT56_9PSEU|nr:TetR/AcrR family transcriptional regulator [Umezawaea endophytica]MCS7481644.1 TetR/AcrR family transcriptional regulator [Umezawaea endophytica]
MVALVEVDEMVRAPTPLERDHTTPPTISETSPPGEGIPEPSPHLPATSLPVFPYGMMNPVHPAKSNEGYLKGRLRREDILTTAITVYAETGYHGSSLREIARRVGMTHAGLLYYFPSKEALLAAVLERRDTDDSPRLSGPPGLDALRKLIALAAHNANHPGIVDLYSRLAAEATSPDHPAHDYFEHHYRMARRFATASFRVLAEHGHLHQDVDPETAALNFIALMDGLQIQWLSNSTHVDLVASLRAYLRSLLTIPLD